MKWFRKKTRLWNRPSRAFQAVIGTLVACVAAVCILLGSAYVQQVNALPTLLDGAAEIAGAPLAWGGEAAGTVGDFFHWLFSWRSVYEENAALKAQVAQLSTQVSMLDEVREENERLGALMGFTAQNTQLTCIPAKVLLRDPGSWMSQFTINKGSADGVTEDMCVVTAEGLVGRISEVSLHQAVVVTVLDARGSVAVVVKRTRDEGILKGADAEGGGEPLCQLHYLLYNANLLPGDEVLTSGLGGVYPRGLTVGRVVSASGDQVLVQPSADIGRLEDVLVVCYTPAITAGEEEDQS